MCYWTTALCLLAIFTILNVGIAQGGALEYLRTSYQSEDQLRVRRIDSMYNVSNTALKLKFD